MPEEINRLYNMEDEVMLTRGQTQKINLQTDLALFTARFPWLSAAYVTSYQTDLATADAFPTDDTIITDIKVLTADVNASLAEGKGALNILFLFAEITYPKDKVRQRVFGQDQMDKARQDQEKMENLLEHAHSFANKDPYKTDLLAKGYTQLEIDSLLTISNNINTKNRLQESAKVNRPVTTQDRTVVYNTVFERMRTVSTCAQVVFAGNPAKIEQYRAYPPASGQATTARVHVVKDGSSDPMPDLTVTMLGTSLPPQITDAGGIAQPFDFGTNPPDTVDIEISGAGLSSSPQTFPDNPLLDGENNLIELSVS